MQEEPDGAQDSMKRGLVARVFGVRKRRNLWPGRISKNPTPLSLLTVISAEFSEPFSTWLTENNVSLEPRPSADWLERTITSTIRLAPLTNSSKDRTERPKLTTGPSIMKGQPGGPRTGA